MSRPAPWVAPADRHWIYRPPSWPINPFAKSTKGRESRYVRSVVEILLRMTETLRQLQGGLRALAAGGNGMVLGLPTMPSWSEHQHSAHRPDDRLREVSTIRFGADEKPKLPRTGFIP